MLTQTGTTWSQNHWMYAMHHRSKQSNKKGFHEEHFSCGWSSENPLQGGGKCNRWNMDLWKSTGKVSTSKMLWWKFSTFAVTCSTLSLFYRSPPFRDFRLSSHQNPNTLLLFSVLKIFYEITTKLFKQFHFGIEIVLSQKNLEGWMVGVWDGDCWDPSQRFWGLEWSSQQNPNKWNVGRCSIKLPLFLSG